MKTRSKLISLKTGGEAHPRDIKELRPLFDDLHALMNKHGILLCRRGIIMLPEWTVHSVDLKVSMFVHENKLHATTTIELDNCKHGDKFSMSFTHNLSDLRAKNEN